MITFIKIISQMQKQTKASKRRGAPQSRVERDIQADRLPQINDQLSVGKILRFTTTGGAGGTTSTTVTFENLLDAWFIAGTATNGYQLFDFVKIKRVTIRAVSSVASQVSVTVGIEFPGLVLGASGSGNQASETTLGNAKIAMCTLKPGKDSPAGKWQPSSSAAAFVVRATNSDNTVCTGAIIDVELAYKNSADISPAALASAPAGMIAGQLYYGGIDGGRLAATWARSVFIPRI